ncbi:MAG TPA: hypothetical protein VGL08_14990, partial [Paraburkholderia sp.]
MLLALAAAPMRQAMPPGSRRTLTDLARGRADLTPAPINGEVCHTMRTIMHANRLHLLIPFALPAAADASTALHAL